MNDYIVSVDIFALFSKGVDVFEGLQTDVIKYPNIIQNKH